MTTPKRAAIYARISKKDENIPKVPDQIAACEKHVVQQGYELVATLSDDGIGAYKKTEREGWDELLAMVERGEIDVIVARGQDRLSRGDMLSTGLLTNMCVAAGVAFDLLQEGYTDPSDEEGEMMIGLRSIMARQQVSRMRNNLMRSNDASRARGEARRGGTRPFGFNVVRGRLVPHPVEALLIELAYREFVTGKVTLTTIRTAWNTWGHRTPLGGYWRPQTVRQLLRREMNIRHIVHRGEILTDEQGEPILGDWPELVDGKTWKDVQTILDARASERSSEPKYLCSSLAHCPCGAKMRLATRNHGETSYRCAVAETGTETDYVGRHTSIATALLDPLVTTEVVNAILSISTVDGASGSDQNDEFVKLHADRRDTRDQIQRLIDGYQEGLLDLAETKKRRVPLDGRLADIDARLTQIASESARVALLNEAVLQSKADLWGGAGPKNLEQAAETKKLIRQRFENVLSLSQRRELIAEALAITVHNGRGVGRVEITHKLVPSLNDDTDHEDSFSYGHHPAPFGHDVLLHVAQP